MSVVNSVSINGLPGTGKTFATAKIVTYAIFVIAR